MSAIIPQPRFPIDIRLGTMQDLPFIDALQKLHSRQVGWMPTKQLEGKIKAGHVLVAESVVSSPLSVATDNGPRTTDKLGYCIGHDQYFKRDDVGIIYQMNVAPGHQRGLIGASLLKAQFGRSAYGCRLYCCWCAQDIEANRFWEAMGFVPLAYRAGSEKKSRVHIFWQKRIRAGDGETPWWFPAQTSGGSIREDRIVLPIPPGTHWSDAKPLILPGAENPKLEGVPAKREVTSTRQIPNQKPQTKQPAPAKAGPLSGALFFAPPAPPSAAKGKAAREKKPKAKNDPKLIAAARELRDRYLEHVNTNPLLPQGKYDVSRIIEATPIHSLPAA